MKSIKLMRDLTNIVAKKYPEQSERIINRANEIFKQLCRENPNQSKKEVKHTREKIYPAISFYKAILEVTKNQKEAFDSIADNFNTYARKVNKKLRVLCKIPFIYKVVPKIMTNVIHNCYGTSSGFKMINRIDKKEKCHIDMTVCPYYSSCVKYGCKELATSFCNSDDIAYSNMHPRLYWGRTKTLARGNDCCNFILEITRIIKN